MNTQTIPTLEDELERLPSIAHVIADKHIEPKDTVEFRPYDMSEPPIKYTVLQLLELTGHEAKQKLNQDVLYNKRLAYRLEDTHTYRIAVVERTD